VAMSGRPEAAERTSGDVAACGGLPAIVLPPQQVRQLGDVGGDAPGLVAGCSLASARRPPGNRERVTPLMAHRRWRMFCAELPIRAGRTPLFGIHFFRAANVSSAGIHFGPVLSGLLDRGGTTMRTRAQR
jgi:hypothetical protein